MNEIGIILHYGIYSIYAYDSIKSAKKRKIANGSEWYYPRLLETGKFRPISGYVETQEYHKKNFNNINYFEKGNLLKPSKEKIKKFIKMCHEKGFKYIILTSKHHDGYCLFDTKSTTKKCEIDICKIFASECKKIGMEYGFYYSWFECDMNFNLNYFYTHCVEQIKELLKYKPNYLWFDGDWKITQKEVLNKIYLMCKSIAESGIKINDRIGKQDNYDFCTFNVKTDRYIPKHENNMESKLQHITTIGYSWGFNKFDEYKSGKELYKIYLETKKFNMSFLLNVSIQHDFTINKNELKSLNDFCECFKLF